jgi:hypothetical protein
VIPPNELDSFRGDLAGTLDFYQGKIAIDIGHTSLRKFADALDTKRRIYRAALSDDNAKAASKAQQNAATQLISHIGALAGLLRELALLVESYSKPKNPGELPASRNDLTALREQFAEVTTSIENLIESIDQVKRVLLRRSRGALNSDPKSGDNRSYRPEPIIAITDYRREAR